MARRKPKMVETLKDLIVEETKLSDVADISQISVPNDNQAQSSVKITVAPPPIVKVEVVKETPTENYLKLEIENIITQIKNNLNVLQNIKHAAHASPVANRIDALLESIKAKL